jgi:hypothetical protein
MNYAIGIFLGCIGLLVGANILAWAMSAFVIGRNDGDYFIVVGWCVLASCFPLAWFKPKVADRISMIATMSYASMLVGVDSHVAFHHAYGSKLAVKAGITLIFVLFLVMVISRKYLHESRG